MADLASFFAAIEEQPLPPVIAMGGDERAFVDDALEIIRTRALEGGMADFNHDRVSAKEASANAIQNLAKQLPTMAPRRLVEVTDADALGEDGATVLAAYAENPCPESVLVLVFNKIDARSRMWKNISKHALASKFAHPREWEMPRLVEQRAKRRKLKLGVDVKEALALTVGCDLNLLDRAFEKLELVCEKGAVSLADVSEHVADTHVEDAFKLGQAVAVADRQAALKSLRALEVARAAPIQLIGLLAWQLRQVLRARHLLDAGQSESAIGQQLNAQRDRLRSLMRAARNFDANVHARRLTRLAFVDQQLKSSRAPDMRWMERLVLELCPPKRSR